MDHVKGYETIVWKTLKGDPDGYTEFTPIGTGVSDELSRLVEKDSEYWNGYMHKVVSGDPAYIKRRKW